MGRVIRVAGAQMGPTQRADARGHTLERMITLLERAAAAGAGLVVFPELAFTTFFPRWLFEDARELDAYFERGMPNGGVQSLFDRALALGVGISVGYAELTAVGKRFNSAVLVAPDGREIGSYRKVHLPGSVEPRADARFQQLEKRYFEYGDLGFPTWRAPPSLGDGVLGMMICNDRRWPEAWRVLALGGVELVCIGYNSAAYDPNGGESRGCRAPHLSLDSGRHGECLHERDLGGRGGKSGRGGWCRPDRRLLHRRSERTHRRRSNDTRRRGDRGRLRSRCSAARARTRCSTSLPTGAPSGTARSPGRPARRRRHERMPFTIVMRERWRGLIRLSAAIKLAPHNKPRCSPVRDPSDALATRSQRQSGGGRAPAAAAGVAAGPGLPLPGLRTLGFVHGISQGPHGLPAVRHAARPHPRR